MNAQSVASMAIGMRANCRSTIHQDGRQRATHRWAMLIATLFGACACFAPLAGCRSLTRKPGPNAPAVATSRQLTQQGISAMERGDWTRAESLLARAVDTCADDADARRNYAETLRHKGAMNDALAQLEEARRLLPEDPGLAVRTGEVYLALGQTERASQMADESLQWDPKFAAAWTLRGQVAERGGQLRQALADYQRSLGYEPDNREVAILVAEAYRQLNEPDRALIALQSLADSYSPGNEPQRVLYLEGLALGALNRYDEAIATLTRASQRDRPTAEILCRLGEAQLLTGQLASAQASAQGALAIDPNHAASRALSSRIAASVTAGRTIRR